MYLTLAASAPLFSADYKPSDFFCPWGYADGITPAELHYFNTVDAGRVVATMESDWGKMVTTTKLYHLLFLRFREPEMYVLYKKKMTNGTEVVLVKYGSKGTELTVARIVEKIDVLYYDWAGVPVNWE